MNLLFDHTKNPLSQAEIDKIVEDSGGMSDQFCRLFTYYFMGYMRGATGTIEDARQVMFQLINQELQKK